MTSLEPYPYDLTWPELDPATHPFDRAEALAVVRSLGPAPRVPVRPERKKTSHPDEASAEYAKLCKWSYDEGWAWTKAMTEALVERYGAWTTGWRWSHDEGDLGGGPVGAWCCSLHSISTPDETLERVARALCEWRDWLEFLARCFDRYPLDTAETDEDRREIWDRATQRLILHSLDRTGSGDAWYAHAAHVLTWFLTRWNVDRDTAWTLVKEAIGGDFKSWTAPETTEVDQVSERLAAALAPPGTTHEPRYTYTSSRLHSYLDE
ncbi:hypothetical protein [Streptomyces sp. NPDC003635]